jgi:hypothetical protein
MLNPIGWIKLHRNLRNSFSPDKKLNIELWMLYVFLAEQAAWDAYDDLKRGQVKIKAIDIQREIFPDMSINRVQKLIQHLIKTNHVKSTPVSKISKEGSIIEVCQYGYFSPEKAENRVGPNWDPTGTQLGPVNFDKVSESLINNHANLADWNPTGTQLEPNWNGEGCSCIIEERNKETKEEKEEFKEGKTSSVDEPPKVSKSLSIIKNDSKKLKRNTSLKRDSVNPKPVIDAYYEAYRQRYLVSPVINSMAGANAKGLIARLGSPERAIDIVRFYLTHNNAFYLKNAHALKFCLHDCEKLHTEFMKKDYIFNKDAKKVEDATANSILKETILSRFRNEGAHE